MSYPLQTKRNAHPFQIITEPNEQNFTPSMTTQQISHKDKASRVSNLRCGWNCQAISVTSVTLYGPSLKRIRCMKSRQSFSRLTRRRVRLARFSLEDHSYEASHLPKTTVLQSKEHPTVLSYTWRCEGRGWKANGSSSQRLPSVLQDRLIL